MTDERLATTMAGAAGLVFDKDGTLIDLDVRWHRFFSDLVDGIVAGSDHDPLGAALTLLLGLTDSHLVADGPAAVESGEEINARIVAEMVVHGHDADTASGIVQRAVGQARFGPIKPIGDVSGTLRSLTAMGFRLGLATSDGVANTHAELAELGLAGTFDPVYCADDGGPVKPDPAVLIGIADAWDLAVTDIVFVGDSRQDLATARAAGARFIARCDPSATPSWAIAEADAIVTGITELVPPRST